MHGHAPSPTAPGLRSRLPLLFLLSVAQLMVILVSVAVLTGAADEESGMLSGLNTAGHEIGGSLGAAILATIAATGGATSPRSWRSCTPPAASSAPGG